MTYELSVNIPLDGDWNIGSIADLTREVEQRVGVPYNNSFLDQHNRGLDFTVENELEAGNAKKRLLAKYPEATVDVWATE